MLLLKKGPAILPTVKLIVFYHKIHIHRVFNWEVAWTSISLSNITKKMVATSNICVA